MARVRRALSLGARSTPSPGGPNLGRGDGVSTARSSGEIRGMTQDLVNDDRYVFVLLGEAADVIESRDAAVAWKALERQMAIIPGGVVPVVQSNGTIVSMDLEAYYLDRCAVTNRQFLRFVQEGGYDKMEIWPQEVWPSLMRFTDKTGRPGPRFWEQGKYPSGKAEHPVVGVCWYEALAYAVWVGKRPPTAAEWQKAGGWPEQISGGTCNRYPWGDIFDPRRANLWPSGRGGTVPVRDFGEGSTPNGIYQMSGNVWEWLGDPLDAIPCESPATLEAGTVLRRIVGGAYDTYFPAEATCHYVTGQPELDRRDNIGFRCCVSAERLRPRP
jgi:iron(II)-dependent oxidoreductase